MTAVVPAIQHCRCGGALAVDEDFDEGMLTVELVCFTCSRRYSAAGVEIRRAPLAEERTRQPEHHAHPRLERKRPAAAAPRPTGPLSLSGVRNARRRVEVDEQQRRERLAGRAELAMRAEARREPVAS